MVKKKDYAIPTLKFVRIRNMALLAGSGELIDNGNNTTSGDVNEEEEEENLYGGLFD